MSIERFFYIKDSKEKFLDSISNFQISQDALNATGILAEMILNVLNQATREDLIKLKNTIFGFIKIFNKDILQIVNNLQINNIYQPTLIASFESLTNMLTTSLEQLYPQFNAMLNSMIMIGTVLCEKAIVKMSKTWSVKPSDDLIPALAGGVVLGTQCLEAYYNSTDQKLEKSQGQTKLSESALTFDQNKNALITAFTIAIEGTSVALLTPDSS